MSDPELEKIKLKKAEMLMKLQHMPQEIVDIQDLKDFDKLLNDYKKIIIIDFWAVWCGPCITFAPIFQKLQEEYRNDFIFAKVNVDEHQIIAMKYGISSIPTTLFIKNNRVLNKVVGAMNYDSMKKLLEKMKDYNH